MLRRFLGSMFEEVAESKSGGNPDRDCGGREIEAINAVQETEWNEVEKKNATVEKIQMDEKTSRPFDFPLVTGEAQESGGLSNYLE